MSNFFFRPYVSIVVYLVFPYDYIDCHIIFTNWLRFVCQKEEKDYPIKFLEFILIEVGNYFVKKSLLLFRRKTIRIKMIIRRKF
jgi:hypothetical protein